MSMTSTFLKARQARTDTIQSTKPMTLLITGGKILGSIEQGSAIFLTSICVNVMLRKYSDLISLSVPLYTKAKAAL